MPTYFKEIPTQLNTNTENLLWPFITNFLSSGNIYSIFRSTHPEKDTTKDVEELLKPYNLTIRNFNGGGW